MRISTRHQWLGSAKLSLVFSAIIVWLTVLPLVAEDPIEIAPGNALELLEAEILKNQQRSSKANKSKKPSASADKATSDNTSTDKNSESKLSPPIEVVVPNMVKSLEESLPPPVREGTIGSAGLTPKNVPLIPTRPTIQPSTTVPNEEVQPFQPASPSGQPYLGLTLQKPNGNLLGLRVVSIADKSPAWKSGFLVSDRVLAVSDQAVSTIEDFAEIISNYAPGDALRFLIDRSGRKRELTAILMDRQLADRSLPGDERKANQVTPPGYRPIGPPLEVDGRFFPQENRSFGLALAPLSTAFRSQFGIPAYRGASVLEVRKNSPASQAGLSPGDCIVEINGQSVESDRDVLRWQVEAEPKSLLSVSYYRGGAFIQTQILTPASNEIEYEYRGRDLPLGATIRPELKDEVQDEILQLRMEVQRLREELRATESRR